MAHQSENQSALTLTIRKCRSIDNLQALNTGNSDVYLFHLPTEVPNYRNPRSNIFKNIFEDFLNEVSQDCIIACLVNTRIASQLIEDFGDMVSHKLWIIIERNQKLVRKFALPDNHISLIIFSKYTGTLRHTKTRIAYTLCPVCNKTTKDYGGKKHLYNPYGTLMSDVWRDISYEAKGVPRKIINRLRDLFGINPHSKLVYTDLRSKFLFSSPVRIKRGSQTENDPGEPRLINGDCLETLSTIPDNSVDFAFADPPYNIKKKYDNWNDSQDIKSYFSWCDQWISELARILKPGRFQL